MCKLKLIDASISSHCIHAGRDLYVQCSFMALEDSPSTERLQLFADFIYGHMTIPENMSKYYRAVADVYPQPMQWKKGEIYTCGLHWQILPHVYGGSFSVNIGMMNDDSIPVEFYVGEEKTVRKFIGEVEVAFGGCAPKFVNSHMRELHYSFSDITDDCRTNSEEYLECFAAQVKIRNRVNDTVFTKLINPKNEQYSCEYVSFKITKRKDEENTVYQLDDVIENKGYELIEVIFDTMLSQKNAVMINVFGGGRKINSKNTYAYGYEQKYHQRNVGVLINEANDEYLIVETPFLDDKLHHSVYKKNFETYASIGVSFTYRMPSCGNLESIRVINKPTVVICKKNTWQDCLNYLRCGLKRKNDLYDKVLFYYIQIECDGHREKMSFRDALERIKHVHNITGGIRQIVLLRGWQHQGHDTGYPDTSELNPTGGTMEDLEYLINEALKYNAIATFHDNFDDMYDELEYFDPSVAALDWNGEYFKSWIWVSGISRMMSFPKYVNSGKMAKRVKETVEKYPVKTSYHLDVLSAEIRRYDYDPEVMSAAQESLAYKLKTINEFEKYGFCVTSEGVAYPFVGVIGHAWNAALNNLRLFYNEEEYPFIPMMFHGYLPYSGSTHKFDIIGGAKAVPDIGRDVRDHFKQRFFEYTLPAVMLDKSQIDEYIVNGNIHTVSYSGGESLIYNENTAEIKLVNCPDIHMENGNVISKGFSDNEYIGYTKKGYTEIDIINPKQVEKIIELDYEGVFNELEYVIKNNKIILEVQPETAFKVVLK